MIMFLAIILGLLFGFILQKVGASNPQKIINMLRLKDFHMMKAILFGIGLSSFFLFLLLALGVISPSHLSVKSSYLGVLIGGLVFGLGWTLSGYCPGTAVSGLGAGRKDAISFLLGGLLGALAYMLVYKALKGTFLFQDWGGHATIAATGDTGYPALIQGVPGVVVAGIIGILFMVIAWKLPLKRKD